MYSGKLHFFQVDNENVTCSTINSSWLARQAFRVAPLTPTVLAKEH